MFHPGQKAHNWVDITGQKFGRWTAIRFHPSKGEPKRAGKWECVCECGKRGMVVYAMLKRGGTKSCGCFRAEVSRVWCSTGNGPRKTYAPGVGAFNKAHYIYRLHARQRGIDWSLTRDQVMALFKQDCHYCSSPPSNVERGKGVNGAFTYSGIDRVDNSRGYTVDNCVPCCKTCNFAKSSMSYEDFTAWLDRVADSRMRLRIREKAVA